MFTLRAAPHHYPEFCCNRRPTTCRQTITPRHMPRYTYPGDSNLLEDLTGTMLLPLFESLIGLTSDKQCGQRQSPKAKNWVHKLGLKGYELDDVTITTKDGHVIIKARRIEGEGDCSDVYESNRSVTIPEGVDISSMKSHFTPDGLLTIVANVKTEDKNMASREVPVDIAKDKEESLPDQDGKGASSEDTQTSDIFDYSERAESLMRKEASEAVDSEGTNTDGDLDPETTDVTIDYDQSPTDNEGKHHNEEPETYGEYEERSVEEAVETSEEDENKVSDEAFTLAFNKDQLAGDDVRVLVKGNSLLVKSQNKTCEDGVSRSVYYVTQHTLPDDIDASKVSCSRRPDGELVVTAPRLN